jgi:DnaJ-class molecular chaperone
MAETTAPTRGRRPARKEATEAPVGPQPCSACRATGRVFATRSGEQTSLPCPWCQGSGEWEPGFDAQAGAAVEAS